MHIMFSSTAGSEENFQVRADWVARLPSVKVKFGMNLVTVIGPTLTVNSKGGSDSRTLYQECLMAYTTRLYPDCADVAGKQVLFKIDGGPGRLDMKLLADLRARGVYLFNDIQNTTQITQETDRNFSFFKSCVCRNAQKLLNEQVRKYNKAKREHNANPELSQHQPNYLLLTGATTVIFCPEEMLMKKTTSAHWNLLLLALSAKKIICELGNFVVQFLVPAVS